MGKLSALSLLLLLLLPLLPLPLPLLLIILPPLSSSSSCFSVCLVQYSKNAWSLCLVCLVAVPGVPARCACCAWCAWVETPGARRTNGRTAFQTGALTARLLDFKRAVSTVCGSSVLFRFLRHFGSSRGGSAAPQEAPGTIGV